MIDRSEIMDHSLQYVGNENEIEKNNNFDSRVGVWAMIG